MDLGGLIPSFGNLALTLAAFVVALSIIVAVHEYGHYIVARWAGIRSEVFSVGFGPVLWSRTDRRGTRWQVAALPFGGYVKFLGDADAASARGDPAVLARMSDEARRQTIHGAPLWARAATVAAGPAFNFALSLLIFAGVFLWQGTAVEPPTVGRLAALPEARGGLEPGDVILAVEDRPTPDFAAFYAAMAELPAEPVVTFTVRRDGRERPVEAPWPFPPLAQSVAPGSAANDAGLRAGDMVLSVDGRPITAFRELQDLVAASEGRALELEVWRDGRTMALELTPKRVDFPREDGSFETRWMIGLTGGLAFEPAVATPGPLAAVGMAADQVAFLVRATISGLWHMVTGAISSCNLRGPIGIAETSGDMARQGLASFIWFVAVLSTAVGLLNLFPIPILDGGHLVFHAWEALTGRPPPERAMRALMAAGLVVVLGIMALALTNDLFCP